MHKNGWLWQAGGSETSPGPCAGDRWVWDSCIWNCSYHTSTWLKAGFVPRRQSYQNLTGQASDGIPLNILGGYPAWATTHWHCWTSHPRDHQDFAEASHKASLLRATSCRSSLKFPSLCLLIPSPPGQLVTPATSKPPTALPRSTYFHTMHLQSPFFICLGFKCQFSLFNQNTSRHKLHKSHSDPQMWCRGSTPGESSSLPAETEAQSSGF